VTSPAPLVVSAHHVGDDPDWWRRAVVYQVYPRSFADSNGDGIGDIPGLTSRLDHLDELGVDVVWLSPVYRSPQDDNGYDISDYQDIDPLFGSLEDLDALIEGLHARGMRLVMDLVVNHTSDEHPWFTASRSSTQDPKRDWYIWRPARQVDGLAPGQPGTEPTNWGSAFSGSAWAWDEDTQEFYLHLFSPKQPDLNWENPQVRHAIHEMMTWWLERGVDGFRMDVINLISKTYPLTDAPQGEGDLYGNAFAAVANGPRIHEFLHEMNQEVLAPRPGHVITVGEMPGATRSEAALYTDPARGELDMVFQFEHVCLTDGPGGKFDPQPLDLVTLKQNLAHWQAALAPDTTPTGAVSAEKGWNSAYWDNHDQPRAVSRFGDDDPAWRVRSAKTLATILHTHRGTPYIYQGEELGMANTVFRGIEDYRDLESVNHFHERVRAGDDPAAVLAGIAPVCFTDLSFPELTAERESVLEELATVSSGPDALAELKVGTSLEAEVDRNTRLLTEPAQPAIRTYTGVLFEALDYASFSPAERDAAHWSLLISSALWGILRPEDAIPAYRLSMGVKLGSIGALASFWKGALGTALEATAKDQLILDCRSAAYAKSWVTPPSQTLAVRVERVAADGSRKVVSHMAKHYRGLFARYLIQSGLAARPIDGSTAGIAEFLEAVSEDWSVECTLPTARKAGVLTLLVHEQ